jgi:hypothetical protein
MVQKRNEVMNSKGALDRITFVAVLLKFIGIFEQNTVKAAYELVMSLVKSLANIRMSSIDV